MVTRLSPGNTWYYRTVVTVSDAGGATILAEFVVPDGEWIIERIYLGPDNYAAGRVLKLELIDADRNITGRWLNSSADNQFFQVPGGEDAALDGMADTTDFYSRRLGKGHGLRIQATSLVQNETLTFAMTVRVSTSRGAIDLSNSTGTTSNGITEDIIL